MCGLCKFLSRSYNKANGVNTFLYILFSLRENYGRVFSIKLGSYKFVMASTPVKKSADYAGRQQTYSIEAGTLG